MEIHDMLSGFIDDNWQEPAKVLYSMWNDQQKAITYKELKEAIRNGSLTISEYMAWQQDYVNWLNTSYSKTVDEAIKFAHDTLVKEHGGFLNMPNADNIERYINNHGGRLIREVSEGQFRAINNLVRQASLTKTMTVDELARSIRPCIGLTERQAAQTQKFYEQLREDGYSKSAALKKQQAFAEKMHRQRAKLIAQTEMAYAANYGMDATVRQSIEDGLISPDVDKEWSACDDERRCKTCGSVHGETVKEDEDFSIGVSLPPAHPACRCAVKYHMRPVERPKNNEPEPANPLPQEEQDGIMNTGDNMPEDNQLESAPASIQFATKTDWLTIYSSRTPPIEGYEDVVCHGDKYGFSFRDANGNDSNVSVAEFAKLLRQSSEYKGGAIRLMVCESGAEGSVTAQGLADELGVDVLAPSDVIHFMCDGSYVIGPDDQTNTGRWVLFHPREVKKQNAVHRKDQRGLRRRLSGIIGAYLKRSA